MEEDSTNNELSPKHTEQNLVQPMKRNNECQELDAVPSGDAGWS